MILQAHLDSYQSDPQSTVFEKETLKCCGPGNICVLPLAPPRPLPHPRLPFQDSHYLQDSHHTLDCPTFWKSFVCSLSDYSMDT